MPKIDLSGAATAARFELPASIGKGQRDVTMHAYASSLQARGVADEEIVALVLEANAERCVPPMPEGQARKCAESAIGRYEKGAAGMAAKAARAPLRDPARAVRRCRRRGRPDLLPDMSGLAPIEQARAWLSALFWPEDVVCLCLDVRSRFPRTEWYAHAGQLLDPADPLLGLLLGACDPSLGLWAVQNPVAGCGGRRRDADVADLRWALVECDELPPDQQLERVCALLFEPEGTGWKCHSLTWSGGKSWHALVYVGAGADRDLYARRVADLYAWCSGNGLPVDVHCANPARLTRVPGVARGGGAQELRWCDL